MNDDSLFTSIAPMGRRSPHLRGAELLSRLHDSFIGLNVRYRLADGRTAPRTYLDSAASTLMLRPVYELVESYLEHYASSHSMTHVGSRIASEILAWARTRILALVDAPEANYSCVLAGSGATAAINKAAGLLRDARPSRDVVLISTMEHHSNDLPHRAEGFKTVHIPLAMDPDGLLGGVDLEALEALLVEYEGRVSYVAITLASNVTGIINPIAEVVASARRHGAGVLLDVAQALPRIPLSLRQLDAFGGVDAMAFSGHKIYAPGSPGVLIVRKSVLTDRQPDIMGGGMVSRVYKDTFVMCDSLPRRQEAGTPNIIGALALGCAADVLSRVGMSVVAAHENALLRSMWAELSALEGITIYGSHDLERFPRVGVVAFNVRGMEYGLVTSILNDYHNLALRDGCFCAHPYVRELLQRDIWALEDSSDDDVGRRLGMVRASLGLYSKPEDVSLLIAGLRDVIENQEAYRAMYRVNEAGDFEHRSFRAAEMNVFDPTLQMTRLLLEIEK